MAHQTHTLPWTLLATHFQYKPPKTHVKPYHEQHHDLVTLQKPTQTHDLKFFSSSLAAALSSFSAPLRSKYPSKSHYKSIASKWTTTSHTSPELPSGNGRKVFSDELQTKYPDSEGINPLYMANDKMYQDIELWIRYAYQIGDGVLVYPGPDERDLPAVIKVLIHEASHVLERGEKGKKWKVGSGDVPTEEKRDALCDEAIETLLRMANHPKVPLSSIKNCGHYYAAGINSIAKSCLQSYIMLNLIVALREAGLDMDAEVLWDSARPQPETFVVKKRYMLCKTYQRMVDDCTVDYDSTGCMGVHLEFLRGGTPRVHPLLDQRQADVDVLADGEKLTEYLKGLWRILVVYDLLIRELSEGGEGQDWEEEVAEVMRLIFRVPYDFGEDGTKMRLLCGDQRRKRW